MLFRTQAWVWYALGTMFVFTAIGVVAIAGGGAMFSPGPLSGRTRPVESATEPAVARGNVHSHAELANNCAACHAPVWSSTTMADRCMACHDDVRGQIEKHAPLHGKISPAHGKVADARSCRECHTEHQGATAELTRLDRFDHAWSEFPLTGAHAAVACAKCHVSGAHKGTASTCAACHAEPKVHLGKFGNACAQCHATDSWKHALVGGNALVGGVFDHSKTAFPLTGVHMKTECKSCHTAGTFRGTSSSCVSCHVEPKVHLGKFGVGCAECHQTATWKGAAVSLVASAKFDHSKTAFPLTGVHMKTECKSCHTAGTFKGTSSNCVSCHAEPQAHVGKFGVGCAECHKTTTWKGANISLLVSTTFDHDKTHFKLMGKHRGVSCTSCHKNSVFVGTAQTCVSCHAEPKVHKGLLGADCVKCHTADSWKVSAFVHKFPVNHGGAGRKGSATSGCAVCHQDTVTLANYTCYGCHAHAKDKMVQRHRNLTLARLEKCAACHSGVRGNMRRAALDDLLPFADLGDACPALAQAEDPRDAIRRFFLSSRPESASVSDHP